MCRSKQCQINANWNFRLPFCPIPEKFFTSNNNNNGYSSCSNACLDLSPPNFCNRFKLLWQFYKDSYNAVYRLFKQLQITLTSNKWFCWPILFELRLFRVNFWVMCNYFITNNYGIISHAIMIFNLNANLVKVSIWFTNMSLVGE